MLAGVPLWFTNQISSLTRTLFTCKIIIWINLGAEYVLVRKCRVLNETCKTAGWDILKKFCFLLVNYFMRMTTYSVYNVCVASPLERAIKGINCVNGSGRHLLSFSML
jgi:hypothetical protein